MPRAQRLSKDLSLMKFHVLYHQINVPCERSETKSDSDVAIALVRLVVKTAPLLTETNGTSILK